MEDTPVDTISYGIYNGILIEYLMEYIDGIFILPSGKQIIAIEHGPVETVDLPIWKKKRFLFPLCKRLPGRESLHWNWSSRPAVDISLLWQPMAYWLKDLESDTNLEVSSQLAVEKSASKMLQKDTKRRITQKSSAI